MSISLATWWAIPGDPGHANRSNTWRIYKGDALLASGVVGAGDPYDSGNPATYVTCIDVAVADVIKLEVERISFYGTLHAFHLTIDSSDTDADGVLDGCDNCVDTPNPTQADCDFDGVGDACEKDNNNNGIPDKCEYGLVLSYCTAGTSTHGCTPAMSATGTPSVTATSGFTVACTGVEGQKFGLTYYGISGKQAVPWFNGPSLFCVKTPVQRTPAANSGGTVELCNGTFSLDFLSYLNAYNSLGEPFGAGDMVWFQTWYRDPFSPGTTNLSNGLQVTMDL